MNLTRIDDESETLTTVPPRRLISSNQVEVVFDSSSEQLDLVYTEGTDSRNSLSDDQLPQLVPVDSDEQSQEPVPVYSPPDSPSVDEPECMSYDDSDSLEVVYLNGEHSSRDRAVSPVTFPEPCHQQVKSEQLFASAREPRRINGSHAVSEAQQTNINGSYKHHNSTTSQRVHINGSHIGSSSQQSDIDDTHTVSSDIPVSQATDVAGSQDNSEILTDEIGPSEHIPRKNQKKRLKKKAKKRPVKKNKDGAEHGVVDARQKISATKSASQRSVNQVISNNCKAEVEDYHTFSSTRMPKTMSIAQKRGMSTTKNSGEQFVG